MPKERASPQPSLWPMGCGVVEAEESQRNLERAGALYQAAADAAERAQDYQQRDDLPWACEKLRDPARQRSLDGSQLNKEKGKHT